MINSTLCRNNRIQMPPAADMRHSALCPNELNHLTQVTPTGKSTSNKQCNMRYSAFYYDSFDSNDEIIIEFDPEMEDALLENPELADEMLEYLMLESSEEESSEEESSEEESSEEESSEEESSED